jgi:hypothetical protein
MLLLVSHWDTVEQGSTVPIRQINKQLFSVYTDNDMKFCDMHDFFVLKMPLSGQLYCTVTRGVYIVADVIVVFVTVFVVVVFGGGGGGGGDGGGGGGVIRKTLSTRSL